MKTVRVPVDLLKQAADLILIWVPDSLCATELLTIAQQEESPHGDPNDPMLWCNSDTEGQRPEAASVPAPSKDGHTKLASGHQTQDKD